MSKKKSNKIDLYELIKIKENKEIKNLNVFNHILELCYKKIRQIAEYGGMSLYYKVPNIIIGYPLYNINNCIEYIQKQLKISGLYVAILAPPNSNYLYISWKLNEISDKAKNRLMLE
jgi:hypothetical protein